MTVRRLHVSTLPSEGGAIELDETASQHVRVLRLRVGDEVELFDGDGRTASARVESLGATVVCDAGPATAAGPQRPSEVTILLAIPKGSTLDECVRMATELGVDRIALLRAERSVPRWNATRASSRLERLRRIATEAAAQSERTDIPTIDEPRALCSWLDEIPGDAWRLVFAARATDALDVGGTHEQVWCAIGPEGGFSSDELAAFVDAGFVPVSLGSSILRVDTAVAAALTLIMDRLRSVEPR